ncbi:MAG: hypothetical protein KAW12_25180 [Candidatus Aminicenantes bacterium]|nr:hypothetical protein [Candidatus Aminicenantes bacterium]
MNRIFQTVEGYEFFLYTLTENFPPINRSTVTLVKRGASLARVSGEIFLEQEFRIVIRERLLFHCSPIAIDWYGYEIWKGEEKLYWYDSQPHPDEPKLESTFPHHKHIPPDIKRNRIPAPDMSFDAPNIPGLIREIEALMEAGDT